MPLPAHQLEAEFRCGAERVALAEDYLGRVFRWAVGLQFVMVAFALVMTALRPGHGGAGWTLVALGSVVIVAGWARLRLEDAYDVARNTSPLLIGATVLAVLLILDDPQDSPLWWIALAGLVVPAVTSDLRRNGACAAILTLGYAAGVITHGHWSLAVHHPDLALKASGFGFWSLLLYATINRTARFMMLWDLPLPDQPPPPLRVSGDAQQEPSRGDVPAQRRWRPLALRRDGSGETRQLEVITLLHDRHTQVEVAQLLRMSKRQVQRHVSNARSRLEVRTTSELVKVAVRDGHIPS